MGGTDDPDGYYGAFDKKREGDPFKEGSWVVEMSAAAAAELHRQIERSDEMRRGAEVQCERYRKELLELKRASPAGNFLDAMVFIESLKHCNGHVDRAITMTREILSTVDAAGGIRGDGDTT